MPLNDENTNIACGPTGLDVGGNIENPKEIQDSWERFEQGRIIVDETLVVVELGTKDNPQNLKIEGRLMP